MYLECEVHHLGRLFCHCLPSVVATGSSEQLVVWPCTKQRSYLCSFCLTCSLIPGRNGENHSVKMRNHNVFQKKRKNHHKLTHFQCSQPPSVFIYFSDSDTSSNIFCCTFISSPAMSLKHSFLKISVSFFLFSFLSYFPLQKAEQVLTGASRVLVSHF